MDLVENQHGCFHRTQESLWIGDALGGAGEIATQVQSLVQAARQRRLATPAHA
jgi:hypothetical protein